MPDRHHPDLEVSREHVPLPAASEHDDEGSFLDITRLGYIRGLPVSDRL